MEIWRNTSEEDLPEEVWRVCDSAPYYEVSSLGRIRVMIEKLNRNGRHFWKGKIITQNIQNKGKEYLRVPAIRLGDTKTTCVSSHRLVAEAFVAGRTENRCEVNHIDGNKSNNNYLNLEWVTPKENTQHAHDTGLVKTRSGNDNHMTVYGEDIAKEVLHRYFYKYQTQKRIEEALGLPKNYASLIIRGVRWKKVLEAFILDNKEHYATVKTKLSKRGKNRMAEFGSNFI